LEHLYGEFASALPIDTDDEDAEPVIFTAASVPRPSAELETDGIIVKRMLHWWSDSVAMDRAIMFPEPGRCRQLGLLCLGVLFHEDVDSVDLSLTSPGSDIGTIRICYESPRQDRYPPGTNPYSWDYNVAPVALQYQVNGHRERFPLSDQAQNEWPHLELTTSSELWVPPETKTHLVGFGSDNGGFGLASVAQLFLDLGSPQDHTRFDLEPSFGWGGVSDSSAMLRVVLPDDREYKGRSKRATVSGPAPGRV
jgi:hypothetical protein